MGCSVREHRRGPSVEVSSSIFSCGPMFADHIGPLYTGRSHRAGIAASLKGLDLHGPTYMWIFKEVLYVFSS